MSDAVARNKWCVILHHASDGMLEQRWLPGQMTDGAFKASLALLALEAERLRPSAILIDATQMQHSPGPGVMEWRNDCIIPRYGSAGVQKFAFHVPSGFPDTIEAGGKEVIDGPAIFPTAFFPGGVTPSSGSRVDNAAQILKQRRFQSCASAAPSLLKR